MGQTVIGIDIGSHSVKAAFVERSFREFDLVAFAEQPISQTARLTPEEAAAAALRSLAEKHSLSADFVSVSLPSHQMSCRVLTLPFSNIKKIEQTIHFELESHLPIAMEDLLVDYHILSIEENQSALLTAYMSRERFFRYFEMLHVAGIDPKYIGVDVIDLSNIAQIAMVPQEACYAILDIGHQKTNLCVMEGTKLRYVRSITVGGQHFTRAIQKAFRLNFEKAEGLKIDRGRVSFDEDPKDQISRICQSIAEELIVGIRQTYLGYRKVYPKSEWSAIFVTGGGSRLAGLTDLISSALKLHVGTLDFLDLINHRIEHPEIVRDIITQSMAQNMRVLFSNKATKINFRRGEFTYKRDIKALGSEIKQVGLWFALVIFLGVFHYFYSYHLLGERVEKANQSLVEAAIEELPELKEQKNASPKKFLNIIKGKIAEIEPQLDALQSGSAEMGPLALITAISKAIPPKGEVVIDIDDLTYTGDLIRLDGRTSSFEAVDKIKSALEGTGVFTNVTTRNVVKGIRDEIKFSLSMDVIAKKEEA